ncbi:MAG: diacylglycerol kinase [Gammaproteobacteria bacterium]|nr:diacylglycerol kinase [Gammaproteobacteria bacterium]
MRGIPGLIRAAGYSWAGLQAAWRYEESFRLEVALCIVLAPLGVWLGQDGIERAVLVGSLLLVLAMELMNSALEALVDRLGAEWHELSGRAKDLGSAAVFATMLNVLLVWGLVLYPHYL